MLFAFLGRVHDYPIQLFLVWETPDYLKMQEEARKVFETYLEIPTSGGIGHLANIGKDGGLRILDDPFNISWKS